MPTARAAALIGLVHEALRLVNGDVDLVIEPPEIIGDTDLESLRLWEDRWEYRV